MGVDITVVIESSADGKIWEMDRESPFEKYLFETSDPTPSLAGSIDLGRDRELFWLLGGSTHRPLGYQHTTNGIERAANCLKGINTSIPHTSRGAPADVSKDVYEFWCWCEHATKPKKLSIEQLNKFAEQDHLSWLSFDEICWILKKHQHWGGALYSWRKVRRRMRVLEKKGRKTRILFWFDW